MSSPNLKSCFTAIDRFLMEPGDLRILNVIRPLFGIALAINMLCVWPDRHFFFGSEGLITEDLYPLYSNVSWKLTTFLPRDVVGVNLYFLSLFAALGSLIVGIYPRVSALIVFILVTGLQNTNNLIWDGEDTMFRLFALFFVFAPGPREVRPERQPDGSLKHPYPVWPLRLFQMQICLMFFACGIEKMKGEPWVDGTAMYYVFRLHDFYKLPLPQLITENLTVMKLMTWGVLVLEVLAPVLIWFRETRRATLALLLVFHLGIELTMNLMMFHWVMIAGWLSFATYEDLSMLFSWFRKQPAS